MIERAGPHAEVVEHALLDALCVRVRDALREIRTDLPHGYYRKLPKLADGPFAGLPRVYALGLELIAHTDSALDETMVTRVVQAYLGRGAA